MISLNAGPKIFVDPDKGLDDGFNFFSEVFSSIKSALDDF